MPAAVQTKDPVEYVSVLLDMRDKYGATISRAFADDKSFRNTLNQVRFFVISIMIQCCCSGSL
jgi:hypothetical protein